MHYSYPEACQCISRGWNDSRQRLRITSSDHDRQTDGQHFDSHQIHLIYEATSATVAVLHTFRHSSAPNAITSPVDICF